MSDIKIERQENQSGDPEIATQGFGRISSTPMPVFNPIAEFDAAGEYFESYGVVVLEDCLDVAELSYLNEFFDRTQGEVPEKWGFGKRKPHHRNQGLIFSQPLLD